MQAREYCTLGNLYHSWQTLHLTQQCLPGFPDGTEISHFSVISISSILLLSFLLWQAMLLAPQSSGVGGDRRERRRRKEREERDVGERKKEYQTLLILHRWIVYLPRVKHQYKNGKKLKRFKLEVSRTLKSIARIITNSLTSWQVGKLACGMPFFQGAANGECVLLGLTVWHTFTHVQYMILAFYYKVNILIDLLVQTTPC